MTPTRRLVIVVRADPVICGHSGEARNLAEVALTRGFDDRDRLIIVLYYYEHLTMREIGATIGISESRVSQRLDVILDCLRSRLRHVGAEPEFVFG